MASYIRAATKKLGLNKVNIGTGVQVATAAGAGYMSYNHARAEGDSVGGALAKATVDAFLIDIIGWKAYLGGALLMSVPKGAASAYEHMNTKAREIERAGMAGPFANSTFVDTEQAYTMRQAGLQMIENSRLNMKKATLGNEAQYLHR